MGGKNYPTKKDIERHKHELFTAMLQCEAGLVPETNVENAIRVLRGDAKLWVMNNWKEMKEAKRNV